MTRSSGASNRPGVDIAQFSMVERHVQCISRLLGLIMGPFRYTLLALVMVLNSLLFLLKAPISAFLVPRESVSRRALSYEEWKIKQIELDSAHNVGAWADEDEDLAYNWKSLRKLKATLEFCRRNNDLAGLRRKLRAQSTRNVCSILSPSLFDRSKIQTKRLIHEYIHELRYCIDRLARRPRNTRSDQTPMEEERRRIFKDARQILGRTTLVLQGGAMLSMCHLGVVKALHQQRILPRIITATGTGALVAAIVGSVPDDVLTSALEGQSININAFARARKRRKHRDAQSFAGISWTRGLIRRLTRFLYTGHFFDMEVLAQCVRDNIGDVTFEEAYVRSGKILNITIAKPDVQGTPQLLNYITAPHVVLWSAVAASVATSKQIFAAVPLQCKNEVGLIVRYYSVDASPASCKHYTCSNARAPMERIGELFDVNHYVVSQTRPYIIPLIRFRDFMSQDTILGALTDIFYNEVLRRADILNQLGLLPTFVQRILIDEIIPGDSGWSKFVIIPELHVSDYFRMFNFPSPREIDRWIAIGERSVWPNVCQLKLRCCIELDIDAVSRSYANKESTVTARSSPLVNGSHGPITT